MELQTLHHPATQLTTRALFLRGTEPERWLTEIGNWGISPVGLECYLVPESIRSVKAAGLLVILVPGKVPEYAAWVTPLASVGKSLLVPIDAELAPAVRQEEWEDLLIWERQLLLPGIGYVGFETSDRLNLADLLALPPERKTDWNQARQGVSNPPPLTAIQVVTPAFEDVMQSMKDVVSRKSPEDIPEEGEGESGGADDLFSSWGKSALEGARSLTDKLSESFSEEKHSTGAGQERDGLLDRFGNWLGDKIEDLEEKRKSEMDRLMDLFDKDPEAALNYAIPLDSPYHQRGTASPGANLNYHDTQFDLGGLGGGKRVDGWNVEGYYVKLRNKYRQTAEDLIKAGNHKKAAYVYAHLLGDFTAAAKALEAGRFFREAATLYKDHLKNSAAAAECLEGGGLFGEAIELYKEVKMHEKVGDLSLQLGKVEEAHFYYQKCIGLAMDNGDYLQAARFYLDKIEDEDKALEVYLSGWEDQNQSEACLTNYVDLLARSRVEEVGPQMKEIFEDKTGPALYEKFMNVLVHVHTDMEAEGLQDTTRELAYRLIAERVNGANKLKYLHKLRTFVSDDHLLSPDTSRYIAQRKAPSHGNRELELQLDPSVLWHNIIQHKGQILALGNRDGILMLGRGNWDGEFEYHSLCKADYRMRDSHLIADAFYSDRILLFCSAALSFNRLNLTQTGDFPNALQIVNPAWLSKEIYGVALTGKDRIVTLEAQYRNVFVREFSQQGDLVRSFYCQPNAKTTVALLPQEGIQPLLYRKEHFYFLNGPYMMRASKEGELIIHNLAAQTLKFTATDHLLALKFAVATEEGCLLLRNEGKTLRWMGDLFANDFEVADLCFLPNSRLAIMGREITEIYDIADDEPRVRHKIPAEDRLVGVLAGPLRDQVAIMDESGRLSVIDLQS